MSDSCLLDFNGILESFSPRILPHLESWRSQAEAEALSLSIILRSNAASYLPLKSPDFTVTHTVLEQ